MHRLPDTIGPKTAFGAQDVHMNVPIQIPPIGVNGRHHSRLGRMRPTTCPNRLKRCLGSRLCHHTKQLPPSKQYPTQLGRDRESQMSMVDVEQAPLRLGRCFRGPRSTAGRAETALAGETHGMGGSAVGAAIASKPVGFGATTQGLLDHLLDGGRDVGGQALDEQRLYARPMVGKDPLQQARFIHPIPYGTVFTLKTTYIFL